MATNITELRNKSTLPAKDFGEMDLQKFFAAHQRQLQSVLPKHMTPERLLRISVNAIRTTPQLMECTVESLLGAVINSSVLGLEPNTPLGQAYLVPFWNSREKRKEVQLIPGYKGLIDLARRSGQIVSIAAHEVCEHDHFEFEYGLDEKLVHRPAWESDRGPVKGAYAVAHLKGGGHVFEVMSREEIEAIRDASQGYQASQKYHFPSPWVDHFPQMARKTVIRRLSNYLPMSIEMSDVLGMDNAGDRGQQDNAKALEGEFHVVKTESGASGPAPASTEAVPASDKAAEQARQEAELAEYGYFTVKGENGSRYFNANGEIWNPEIHATSSETGGPVMNKDGSFRARRGTVENPPQQDAENAEPADNTTGQEEAPAGSGASFGLD